MNRFASPSGSDGGEVERAAAEDLERLLALVLVQSLDEQDAVEVVELVLEHTALELGGLDGDLVPSRSRPTRCTALGRTISQLSPGTDRQPSSKTHSPSLSTIRGLMTVRAPSPTS